MTPETNLNSKAALVNNSHVPSVFHSATLLDVNLRHWSDSVDDTDSIDSPHLLALVYLINGGETEAKVFDAGVVVNRLDLGVLVEYNRVVILDTSVFGVSHIDLAVFKQIDFVFLKFNIVVVGLVVEESGLYLRSLLVNELYVEKGSFRSRILPHFLSMLFSYSSFDLPVEEECVQSFNGREALVLSITPLVSGFSIDCLVNCSLNSLGAFNFNFRMLLLPLLVCLGVLDVREVGTLVLDGSSGIFVANW